jgi:hypothetical protein
VGIGDRLKQGAEATRQKIEESREESKRRNEEQQAAEAERRRIRAEERQRLFKEVSSRCPLPIKPHQNDLPGGIRMFDDEFEVATGNDWGWSSKKLVLTTQRCIYAQGRALTAKNQKTVYLRDIRDVRFHKPLVGFGTIALDTAGAGSFEGLPAARDGANVRNKLLELIHFARNEAEHPASTAAPATAAPTGDDVMQKLKQLGELREAGIVSDEEFEAKKADLLARL